MVHSSYGNDTYESVARCVLIVPSRYHQYMQSFLTVYNDMKVDQHHFISSLSQLNDDVNGMKTRVFSIHRLLGKRDDDKTELQLSNQSRKRKHKRKLSIQRLRRAYKYKRVTITTELIQIVFGLHVCGVVSLHHNNHCC